jgi:adenylosuccinate lyase
VKQTEPITPIDGRNQQKLLSLSAYFSEYALNKYRLKIEIEYLKKLSKEKIIPLLTKKDLASIDRLIETFDSQKNKAIKKIEAVTNHDVKAVEYYLRDQLKKIHLQKVIPFVHIGATSEDINNLSYACILKDSGCEIMEPLLATILKSLKDLSIATKNVPLLGRTHGQPAVTTTVAKEIVNYYYRLQKQQKRLSQFKFEGKFNGAVGNFNAIYFVYPDVDWIKFSTEFVTSLDLQPNLLTTQILPYDNWIEYFQIISLINGILFDFSINIWEYIMLEVFSQKRKAGEVGSSTMPQKINPINFEHAEGSLQVANSLFEMYGRKLVASRLQRDLSDSTVRRTFSEAFGYTVLGWQSIVQGLSKITVNSVHIQEELSSHWEILAEAIQTYLRSRNDEKAYEKLKDLTQGKKITRELYLDMLKILKLDKEEKFINLSPEKYSGLAEKLVDKFLI